MAAIENEPIFALDIGTRTVIGVLAHVDSDGIHVLHQTIVEHPDRAMYDGQIHDIPRVATAVGQVKDILEKKVGHALTHVAVAAAGRSLRTQCCQAHRDIDPHIEIDHNIIRSLEVLALRQAHAAIEKETTPHEHLYCVGYSPIRYQLDGLPLANLIGHRGQTIGVEAIVTFLPASVVNGLLSVLHRVGLEPVNLTLEPIAALDVALPPDVRLLNLALVDIGAGTSDIALTRDGGILAYGMVPIAGDEITEAIMKTCLSDFPTAEGIKRSLAEHSEIVFQNVLGIPETIGREAVLEALNPVLSRLTNEIAAAIRQLNGGEPPRSVILIGGGAQLPTLPDLLASALELPSNRVVVRGRDMLRSVHTPEGDPLSGPQGITVLGIASLAARHTGQSFLTITVNDREYRIFDSKNVNVAYILGLVEFDPRQLFGRNGKDLVFTLNGRQEIVRGGLSRPARLTINGQPANLQTPVQDKDQLYVIPAEHGVHASAKVGDYCAGLDFTCTINGKQVTIEPTATLNDLPASADTSISPGDVLVVTRSQTVSSLLRRLGLDDTPRQITVNGYPVGNDYVLQPDDNIVLQSLQTGPNSAGGSTSIQVIVNGRAVTITGIPNPIFVDVFQFVEVFPQEKKGHPTILLNNSIAEYTRPLKDGDDIKIIWDEE